MKNEITIKELKVGEQFNYNGFNYTKLDEDGLCILDDFKSCEYQRCCFDNVNNDYETSLIRHYINSDKFINYLGLNLADIKRSSIDGFNDYLFLLSKAEYLKYRPLIKYIEEWYWLRSAGSLSCYACIVLTHGSPYSNIGNVTLTYGGLRPALHFNLDTKLSITK